MILGLFYDLLLPQQLQNLFPCQLVRKIRTFEQGIGEIFFRVMQADDFLFDGPLGNQVVDRYRTGLADPVGPV